MGNPKSLVFVITSLAFLVFGSICSQLIIQNVLAAPPDPCFNNPACGSVCIDIPSGMGPVRTYCCWAPGGGLIPGNMCQVCIAGDGCTEPTCCFKPPPPPSTETCPENTARDPFGNCSPVIQYTHRRVLDDPAGNKVGWNPDGQTKVFGIVDSKFNPQTSVVLINTFNSVLPGVVCNVDHRGYAASGPAFEVNCGGGNPSAVAPKDGTALDYLIITMPFSPPDTGIFNPTTGQVIPRINMTGSTQMENQTQVIRPMDNSSG